MQNEHGFTLIELLAVIIVLSVVLVIATSTILPMMSDARERAFRVAATDFVKYTDDAYNAYRLGTYSFDAEDKTQKCNNTTTHKICVTVDKLIEDGMYPIEEGNFQGRIEIDYSDVENPVYTIFYRKGVEFRIVNQSYNNYIKSGELNDISDWDDDYLTCNCD